jgi:hydroxypyruvate reductase
MQEEMRAAARTIFDRALQECSIPRAFSRELSYTAGLLSVSGQRYELPAESPAIVVSVGKAGDTMAHALAQIIASQLTGIVSCPTAPENPVPGLRYFIGGHPMPNDDSLRAGKAILELLHGLTETALVLFCISGGASAIVEWPLNEDLTLSDIVATNRALVLSGAPIAEINAIRKHLSAIKGGRAARAAFPARQVSLLVSDVPDHALDALASGPTMPDTSTVADCYAIVDRYGIVTQLSQPVREIFECRALEETPKSGDPAFSHSQFVPLLSNRTAVAAAAEKAKAMGFDVTIDNTCDDWDYAHAVDYLLAKLRDLRKPGARRCLISGGEVTVRVSGNSGIGGRNQQFALYCATKIAGEPITVLSAGTDGIDGNSPAAGALVDGSTIAHAASAGMDQNRALADFNAFPLFDKVDDSIVTGPTGNNVRDLRILLAY